MDEWLLISCTRHDQECERRMNDVRVKKNDGRSERRRLLHVFFQTNQHILAKLNSKKWDMNWRNVSATYILKKTSNSMSFLEKQKSCSKLYVKIIFLWKAFTKKWFKNDIVFFWNNEKMECSENVFLWNALPLTSWWKVDLWKHYYSATISFWNHLITKWMQQAMMTMWYASN